MSDVGTLTINLTANASGLKAGLASAQGEVQKTAGLFRRSLGGALSVAGGIGIASLFGKAAGGIGDIVTAAADFEQQMSGIKAVTGATGAEFDALRAKSIQLGKDTVFSASESANAIEELAKAGVSTKDILGGAADGAVALAAATGTAIPTAATIMANAMNEFGLAGNQATHVADLLAAGANKSATDAVGLGEALAYVGTGAHAMNVSIEDTIAALAALADVGITGSAAGTNLNDVFNAIAKDTPKTQRALAAMNVTVKDQNGNFVGLSSIIKQVAAGTKNMTDIERENVLVKAFGIQGARAMLALLTTQTDQAKKAGKSWEDYQAGVNKAGAANDAARTRMDNFKGSMEQFKGSLQTLEIVVGTALLPALRGIVDVATNAINSLLSVQSAGDLGALVIRGAITLGGDLADAAGDLWGWLMGKLEGGGGVALAGSGFGTHFVKTAPHDLSFGDIVVSAGLLLAGDAANWLGNLYGWIYGQLVGQDATAVPAGAGSRAGFQSGFAMSAQSVIPFGDITVQAGLAVAGEIAKWAGNLWGYVTDYLDTQGALTLVGAGILLGPIGVIGALALGDDLKTWENDLWGYVTDGLDVQTAFAAAALGILLGPIGVIGALVLGPELKKWENDIWGFVKDQLGIGPDTGGSSLVGGPVSAGQVGTSGLSIGDITVQVASIILDAASSALSWAAGVAGTVKTWAKTNGWDAVVDLTGLALSVASSAISWAADIGATIQGWLDKNTNVSATLHKWTLYVNDPSNVNMPDPGPAMTTEINKKHKESTTALLAKWYLTLRGQPVTDANQAGVQKSITDYFSIHRIIANLDKPGTWYLALRSVPIIGPIIGLPKALNNALNAIEPIRGKIQDWGITFSDLKTYNILTPQGRQGFGEWLAGKIREKVSGVSLPSIPLPHWLLEVGSPGLANPFAILFTLGAKLGEWVHGIVAPTVSDFTNWVLEVGAPKNVTAKVDLAAGLAKNIWDLITGNLVPLVIGGGGGTGTADNPFQFSATVTMNIDQAKKDVGDIKTNLDAINGKTFAGTLTLNVAAFNTDFANSYDALSHITQVTFSTYLDVDIGKFTTNFNAAHDALSSITQVTFTTAVDVNTGTFFTDFQPVLDLLNGFEGHTFTTTVSVDTSAAINALNDLANHLPHSPAKKGPLSKPASFDTIVVDPFRRAVERMKQSMSGVRVPSVGFKGVGGASGGGERHYHFHNNGTIIGEKDLAHKIATWISDADIQAAQMNGMGA